MPPEPGIWPRDQSRPTESNAEGRVYDALKSSLPEGWFAWHSLRIRTRDGMVGEGDFVIAVPNRGMLVLEVKGGAIEERDGCWTQNRKLMDKAPLQQGLDFAHRLEERLTDEGCRVPAFGAAVCFPDCAFEKLPTQDDLSRALLGSRDLAWLGQALQALVERVLPKPRPAQGRWIDALHRLWGETWIPRLSLGSQAQEAQQASLCLDATQIAVLNGLHGNARVLVSGPAGSGKTLLAAEAARRQAADGGRVLLLCFTRALATWLRKHLAADGIEVQTVSAMARQIVEKARGPVQQSIDQRFWRDLSLAAAELAAGWDAVVIDEAQDLTEEDWFLVEALARGGRLWAFQDEVQRFWPDRKVHAELFQMKFTLPRARRSPSPIQALANRCLGVAHDESALREGLRSGALAAVRCTGSVADKLGAEVDRLLSDGLQPRDIAIVSLRGQDAPDSIHRLDRVGRHPLVRADATDMGERLVADSFLHWKGLERPAVLLTDFPGPGQAGRGVRFYIALTRALLCARIVAPAAQIDADPALTGL